MSFAVAKFLTENSYAIVPVSWFQDDHCQWPDWPTTKVQKAIRTSQCPIAEWPRYPCSIKAICASYEDAYKKLLRYDLSSDIDSQPDNSPGRGKRTKRMVDLSQRFMEARSDSEDSTDNVSAEKIVTLVEFDSLATIELNLENNDEVDALIAGNAHATLASAGHGHATPASAGHSRTTPASAYPVRARQNAPEEEIAEDKPQKEVNRIILKELFFIKQELKQLRNSFSSRQGLPGAVQVATDLEFSLTSLLPIRNIEQFREFEALLQNKESLQALTNHLSSFGGASTSNAVNRMMDALMANEMGSLLNLSGKNMTNSPNSKAAFRDFPMAKSAVFGGVRHVFPSTTREKFDVFASRWLLTHDSRGAARKRRRKAISESALPTKINEN